MRLRFLYYAIHEKTGGAEKINFTKGRDKTPKRRRFPKIAPKIGVKILSQSGHNFHPQIVRQFPQTFEKKGFLVLKS